MSQIRSQSVKSRREVQLLEQIKDAGNMLLNPPSAIDDLTILLEKVECLLADAEEIPSRSIKDALEPSMKALIADELLRHADSDVRVSVASCISKIIKISIPDASCRYCGELMKEIFQLFVSTFENLSHKSGPCYRKALSILDTIAEVKLCLLMLDLECEALIIETFRIVLKVIRWNHPYTLFTSMAKIMIVVIDDKKDVSWDLLSTLLASVRKENRDVSPISWKLGENIITNCAAKLKPYLMEAVQCRGIALDEYSEIVTNVCNGEIVQFDLLNGIEEHFRDYLKGTEEHLASEKSGPAEELVGSKIKVWWPIDKMFYEGVVDAYDHIKKEHRILYTDGMEEILNLNRECWELIGDDVLPGGGQVPDVFKPDASSERLQKRERNTKFEPAIEICLARKSGSSSESLAFSYVSRLKKRKRVAEFEQAIEVCLALKASSSSKRTKASASSFKAKLRKYGGVSNGTAFNEPNIADESIVDVSEKANISTKQTREETMTTSEGSGESLELIKRSNEKEDLAMMMKVWTERIDRAPLQY